MKNMQDGGKIKPDSQTFIWRDAEIGSLCLLTNGRAFKPIEWSKNGLPIIRIQNLNNPHASYNHFSGLLDEKHLVKKGDLLFAWSGTPGTSFGAHVWRGGDSALNQHIFKITLVEDLINKAYFRYAINQKLSELIGNAQGGVGLRHVTKKAFEGTLIPMPPLAEQEEIASRLDDLLGQVDQLKARLAKIPTILKRFRQSVLTAATTGHLTQSWREEQDIGKNWQWCVMGKSSIEIQIGPFGSLLHKSDYIEGSIPVINPMHIVEGKIIPSEKMCIGEEKAKALERYRLRTGDVILGRRGEMGRAAVVDSDSYICGTGSVFFRPNGAEIDSQFLCHYLRSVRAIAFLEASSVGSTMTNLNQKVVRKLPFPVVGIEEQQEIVRRVEELFAFADQVEARSIHVRVSCLGWSREQDMIV